MRDREVFDPENPDNAPQEDHACTYAEGRWVTFTGPDGEGTSRVFINKDGKVSKGPSGVKGKDIEDVDKDKSDKDRKAQAKEDLPKKKPEKSSVPKDEKDSRKSEPKEPESQDEDPFDIGGFGVEEMTASQRRGVSDAIRKDLADVVGSRNVGSLSLSEPETLEGIHKILNASEPDSNEARKKLIKTIDELITQRLTDIKGADSDTSPFGRKETAGGLVSALREKRSRLAPLGVREGIERAASRRRRREQAGFSPRQREIARRLEAALRRQEAKEGF